MKISQTLTKKLWSLKIDFENYTFTNDNGNGPYYICGDFNQWDTDNTKYKVKVPKNGGGNILQPHIIKLAKDVKTVEFKIFNSGKNTWIEPSVDNQMYKGDIELINNSFGSLNVAVPQISPSI